VKEDYPPAMQRAIDAAIRRGAEEYVDEGARTRVALKSGKPLKVLPSPNQSAPPFATAMPRAKGRVAPSPYRSALEQAYAERLELQRIAGEILWWLYEPWRFSLGGGAWYKVDFGVMLPGGELEAIEVKGFWREAARLRIKVAASKHPLTFKAVTRKDGEWSEEHF